MKSPFYFIVHPYNGRRYDNVKSSGGVELITSVSEDDYTASNRFAIVDSVPVGYDGDIEPGDVLLVHHNVFKFYYDMRGVQRSDRSFFKDNVFFVDKDQFFLYKKSDGIWRTHDKYCFVKGIPPVEAHIMSFSREESLMGEMIYLNKKAINMGLKKGDIVAFPPKSTYEFRIDGEIMYRLYDSHIIMKV